LSILSHELKAPLNGIEGYLKIIRERQMGNDVGAYIEMIDRSLERIKGMRFLILDLLDLTRIDSNKPSQDYQDIKLNEIARNSIDTLRPYAIQRDVNVYLNANEVVFYHSDANEMQIIFNNLISNAVKYNKDGGRVDCNIKSDKDNVYIYVADTGIGISEENMSTIFNDFVRVKSPETRNISGSGLGLSIVRKIVDVYKGTIEVKSKPGEGSNFSITLPKKN
jgi:signal transduction histidine kinase